MSWVHSQDVINIIFTCSIKAVFIVFLEALKHTHTHIKNIYRLKNYISVSSIIVNRCNCITSLFLASHFQLKPVM